MNIIHTETLEYPLSEIEVRARFPESAFADHDFPPVPYAWVQTSTKPTINALSQDVVEGAPALNAGVWTQTWVVSDCTAPVSAQRLSDAQAGAWLRIKTERDRRRFDGGVLVGTNWFLSTEQATLEYTTLVSIATSLGVPDSYVMRAAWRTMVDGVTVDMTPGLAKQILQAGLSVVAATDDASQTHKANMLASHDPANYDFSGGWPVIYGG